MDQNLIDAAEQYREGAINVLEFHRAVLHILHTLPVCDLEVAMDALSKVILTAKEPK